MTGARRPVAAPGFAGAPGHADAPGASPASAPPSASPPARRIRFGFQTHVHGHAPAHELLPGLVDLFVAAEELGFDSGWIAQHHLGNDAGRLPSPLVVLAAAASRTTRIRLGTSVVVLPLEEPLRLAEDAAVVDALSGGRLELGLGTGGVSAGEFAAFGKDAANRRELYRAGLDRLTDLLRGEGLPEGLALTPRGDRLLGRLWEAASTPERAAEVARAGNGLLLGVGTPAQQRAQADAYLAAFATARDATPDAVTRDATPDAAPREAVPDAVTRHAADATPDTSPGAAPRASPDATPRIAAFRGAFPGSGREERAETLWPDVRGILDHPLAREIVSADAGPHELLAALVVHYGTPAEIVDGVLADPALPIATDYAFAVQARSTPIPDAIRALETIAADVRPELERRLSGTVTA